jgi:hypothetical protein
LSTKIRSVHGSLAGREASDKKCARGIDPALDWTRAPRYCVAGSNAAPVVVLMMTPLVPNGVATPTTLKLDTNGVPDSTYSWPLSTWLTQSCCKMKFKSRLVFGEVIVVSDGCVGTCTDVNAGRGSGGNPTQNRQKVSMKKKRSLRHLSPYKS